ncbi:TPA: SMI1/KNR4 family protein [Elizabethkingia anophelis]
MTRICFTADRFDINGNSIALPLPINELESILGEARVFTGEYNTVYTWPELGIKAYSKERKLVETVDVVFEPEDYEHSPEKVFTGELLLNGTDIKEYYINNKDKRVKLWDDDPNGAFVFNNHSLWLDIEDGVFNTVSIEAYTKGEAKTLESLPLDAGFEDLAVIWNKWIAAIKEYVDEDNAYYNLTHGITAGQMHETEVQLEVPLPGVLLNFYKVHNVRWNAVTSAFSFSVNGWSYDLLPFEKIIDEWEEIQDLNDDEVLGAEMKEGYSDNVKAVNYANPKWIPFAEGRNGDYLLIDTDPSEKGTFGQIIELQNEGWTRSVVASSLEELITQEIEIIKSEGNNRFGFIQENGKF